MQPQDPWVSASDLAEYAYCPRSYWYSTHPEETPGRPSVNPRAVEGIRYHRRALGAEGRREGHGGLYVGLLVVGLAIVLVGLVVWGGV